MLRFERSDGRWYKAYIERDLLGHLFVVRVNGGKIKKKGRLRRDPCADRDQAIDELAAITRTRLKNGYKPVRLDSLD
jgi:hypothetical protein